MNIQIFGTKKCNDTKKAERFFKERGIKYQFINKKYNIEHLYLFGSYATGTAIQTIDIFDYDKCTNEFLKEDIAKYGKQLY